VRELIKLVELGLQQLLVGQAGLVFGHERGRHGSAQCVFNDFLVPCGAEQHADGRPFVRRLHVPVERFEVKLQLTEMLGLELVNFQFKGHQAVERPVEEQLIECEISPAHLERVPAAHVAEVAAKFDEELL
jgi:hypothetical protein